MVRHTSPTLRQTRGICMRCFTSYPIFARLLAGDAESKSADEVDEELAPWVARSDVMSQIASLRRKMAGAKKGTDAERVLGDLWIEFEKWSETR